MNNHHDSESRASAPEWIQPASGMNSTASDLNDADLAKQLVVLVETIHPDPDFKAGLRGELNQATGVMPDLTRPLSTHSAHFRTGIRWAAPRLSSLAGIALLIAILLAGVQLVPKGGVTPPAPATVHTPTATSSWKYYTVQSGDTLASIAQNTGVGLKDLLAYNRLEANTPLQEGQRLILGLKNSPTKAPIAPSQRLTLSAAEQKIRAWYQAVLAEQNAEANLQLGELTTPEIWNRLELQVFQISGGVHRSDTFLIRNGQVQQMGMASGGNGLTALAVADLDADGQPELLYTFSFGSQPERSVLALYSPDLPGEGVLTAGQSWLHGELHLKKIDDQQVIVEGAVTGQGSVPLGQATLAQQSGRPELGIQLEKDLSSTLRSNLSTQPIFPPTGLAAGQGTFAMTADVNGLSQVFVWSSQGGDLRRVSDGTHASLWPSLSPDGRRVAFAVNYDGKLYDFDLVVVDLADGTVHRLTSDPFAEQHPVWSPDGSQIAFESDRDSSAISSMEIFVMNADGSNPRRVLGATGMLNGWSADGTEIYCTKLQSDARQNQGLEVLTSVRLVSGQTREIRRLPQRVRGTTQAAVSPDGQQIAYIKDTETGSAILLVENGVERLLSDRPGDAFLPIWSPDGQWLAYSNLVEGVIRPIFVQLIGDLEIQTNMDFHGQITSWVAANPLPPQ